MWTLLIAALIAEPLPAPTPGPTPTQTSAPDALGPHAIAQRAADTSPAVTAALANARAADARAARNDQRFYPRITTTARYTRISESDPLTIDGLPIAVAIPAPIPDQFSFGAEVAVPLTDWLTRYHAAHGAGRHAAAVDRALAETQRQKSAAEAVTTYWQWQRARLGVQVATASIADAESHLAAAQALVRAEAASIADQRLAEAGVAQAKLELAKSQHAEALALAAVRTALHDPTAELAATDPNQAPWPIPGGDAAALEALALTQRPELKALASGTQALSAQSQLARADRWPRLDLVAHATVASPSPRGLMNDDKVVALWDASLVASWNVNGLWETTPAEDELAAQRAKLAADRAALEDGVHLEVALALRDLADADAEASASQAMLIAAEEAVRVRTLAYRAGRGTSVELTSAETQLTLARLGIANATIDRRVAEVHLLHALGQTL